MKRNKALAAAAASMMLTGTLSGCSPGSTDYQPLYGPPPSPAVIESPAADFPSDVSEDKTADRQIDKNQ